ncbi:unnamed protein product [Mytilus coruscus]|uniref:Reverse transcriptase RNase H-like domain-containing protein n=1 Tax=Mytilus coruscus TaxID=42192 RepID=A0A6J8AEZ1_MYTCO|nr:unnamed protein product [Mytilus coruscus]
MAVDHTVIPGYSEVILEAYVEKTDLDSWFVQQEFLIEPSPDFMEKSCLIISTCLVDLASHVTGTIRLMNPFMNEVIIHQNTVIGTAHSNEFENIHLMNIEDNSENETSRYSSVRRLPLNQHKETTSESKIPEFSESVTRTRPEPKPNIGTKVFKKAQIGRNKAEIKEIASLLHYFEDTFSKNEDDIGLTHLIDYSIDTGTAKPIKQPPRRVPLAFADKEKKIVQQMERQGIIRKSTSPWGSPLCLVLKKSTGNTIKIASPMINLTKKSENFVWSSECQESFEKIKDLLMTAPIVSYSADHGGYILDADACDTGIGAVLNQVQEGQEKVIAYGSRTLNKAERNYCVTDKELLALRYFIDCYRQYLLGRKFSVRVDHQPLVWLFSLKEPKGRIAKWIEMLSAYDFSIIHRPGKKHGNADGLSRCPQEQCLCSENDILESLKCGPCNKHIKRSREMESTLIVNNPKFMVNVRAVTRSETANLEKKYETKWKEKSSPCKLSQLQEDDTDIYPILDGLQKNEKLTDLTLSSPATRHYFNLWDSLTLLNNVVYKRFYQSNGSVQHIQLLTPSRLIQEVLTLAHDSPLSGHF